MEARRKKNTTEEKCKFVTIVLSKVKLPAEHRKSKSKELKKRIRDKTPREFGPEDITIHTRSEHLENLDPKISLFTLVVST